MSVGRPHDNGQDCEIFSQVITLEMPFMYADFKVERKFQCRNTKNTTYEYSQLLSCIISLDSKENEFKLIFYCVFCMPNFAGDFDLNTLAGCEN